MNTYIEIGSRRVSKESRRTRSSVTEILRYYWRLLQLYVQVLRERRLLASLSPDQLDDIGISPQQAHRESGSLSLSAERLSTL
jgi:uncharacterized protein YjiS (DUF1127 family)